MTRPCHRPCSFPAARDAVVNCRRATASDLLAWFNQRGMRAPERYVAMFDDSEALHRGAAAGVGVALGKLTRVRLLIESGQLVVLTPERLQTDYAHYLVYPPRLREHDGRRAFKDWLHQQARDYVAAAGDAAAGTAGA